jgi:hypothetical protein
MSGIDGRAPHADGDPRRGSDPDRANVPEGLRRERKSAYGPTTGRRGETKKREAAAQQAAKKD